MRTQTDFSPLYRSFIGFDHLAGLIEKASRTDKQSSYPPYNIELLILKYSVASELPRC